MAITSKTASEKKKPASKGQAAKAAPVKAKSPTVTKVPVKVAPAKPAKSAKAIADVADELDDFDDSIETEVDEGNAKPKAKVVVETPPDAETLAAREAVAALLTSENVAAQVSELVDLMLDERPTVPAKTIRILQELVLAKPETVATHVEKFARSITSPNKRVAQASADALPAIARVAPARVAKQLETLKNGFEPALEVGKDGLVRTFANLCIASVAYQKRLEPILTTALESADGKNHLPWSEIVLPALKGEPHARARAVVEERLDRIPRRYATEIATSLGIRLRVRY